MNKKIKKVSASGNKIVTGKNASFNDFVSAELIFEDGIIAKVNSNFGCVYPHFHKLNIYGSLKTFEKFPSLTKDLINLIPEKLSWTYVDRSDNDSCIFSDLLLIIF